MRARALYDNEAETPDELSFRRDDILIVLEQDTDGIEGWWLCQLGQSIGIAPGNRLKVISYTSPPISGATDMKIIIQRSADISPVSDYDVPQCMTPSLTVPRICGGGKLTKSYSAGDLLATSDDYDTPSCTSDYDTPVSNPREAPTNNAASLSQKDAKTKTHKTKTGKKIKNFFKREQRSSVTEPPNPDLDLYDTPMPSKRATKSSSSSQRKTESGKKDDGKDKAKVKKTKNQLNPKDCTSNGEEGDSSLSDYDVPHSSPLSTTINRNTGKCMDTSSNRSSPVLGIKYREKIECPSATSVSQDNKTLNHSTAPKLDDLISSFKSLCSDLLVILQQIDENSPKWLASKNALTRASIVRLTCFSAWKKLQTLLGCVSQIATGLNRNNISLTSEDLNLSTLLKLLNVQSNSLEKIIEFLTTQNSESLENDNGGYVNTAVTISAEIRRIMQLVTTSIEEHKALLASDTSVPPLKIMITQPSMDFLDAGGKTDESRRTGNLLKNSAFSKSSSDLCDDSSQNKTAAHAKRELVTRRSMDNILGAGTEDYDTPTNVNRNRVPLVNGTTIIPATLRENRNVMLLKHNADVKSFDVVKEKRGAIVMDKGEHKFDILVRRYSDSKMAPSVMVFGVTKGENAGDGDTAGPEEMVDYDYPLPSVEVESHNQISTADTQLLKFYARGVVDETAIMKTACSHLFRLDDLNQDVDRSKTVLTLAKTVLISSHKLSFTGDTILKSLSPGPLKARIQLRSEELCKGENVKAILAHAKMAAVGDPNASAQSRKRLAETAKDMLLSAFQFAEIISRPH